MNRTPFKRAALAAACVSGLAAFAPQAFAQTTFDVIGPHEYELPVGFKPFNVFVQYGYVQDNKRVYDDKGDKVDGSGAQTIVGLSKYVRFWSPESHPEIGLAYEVIVPEISVRDGRNATQSSGIGDPLTGFAVWYKPTAGSTLGFQSFVQIPAGSTAVSDKNWKNLSSFLWDVRLPADFGWTADAGYVWQGKRSDGLHPGNSFHTNQRLGWRANSLLEPFVALDYENAQSRGDIKSSRVTDLGAGVMFHTFDNQSISLRYAASVNGRNHSANNSINLKYAYVW
ncbi:transporter [Derxia lacustris]|uniref:transporter n=1 Tax=Derxia lacustris TaxID=764842 RepID=UPI000A170E22|nr:transporter [Derxia lacustris]